MDAVAEKLDRKLQAWRPETSDKVRSLVSEIIALADDDAVGWMRSREAEQEVLNLLDEPATR